MLTCAVAPLPPTTGSIRVTVLLTRPLIDCDMLLWETGGSTRRLPPSLLRTLLLPSMMRVARSCSSGGVSGRKGVKVVSGGRVAWGLKGLGEVG